MGLPEEYVLPENYNEAYHLTGDGVVVSVVRFLAEHLIEKVPAAATHQPPRRHEHHPVRARSGSPRQD